MSVFYLDSSAWVKRYVMERGSAWVHTLFDRQERIASATLGYVEVVAALSRRLSDEEWARIEPRLTHDWQNMTRLSITSEAMDHAVSLAHHWKLRGADAVHLAIALNLRNTLADINEPVILIASDDELLEAARGNALPVENPGTLPEP